MPTCTSIGNNNVLLPLSEIDRRTWQEMDRNEDRYEEDGQEEDRYEDRWEVSGQDRREDKER